MIERNVARVLLAFEPPDGGVAENVLQLALGLRSHGHEPELAGPLHATIYPEVESAGVAVSRFPFERGYGRPGRDAAAVRGLARLLRTGRHDLVHCHSAKVGVLGRLAARRVGIPTVYSPHSFPFVGDFSAARRLFAMSVERALAPLTTALLCVCEEERQIALRHRLAAPGRAHMIHNGCPPCDTVVRADERLHAMGRDGPLAAAITVLRPQKSVDVLIDAAPLVFERLPQARLAVVGDGPLSDELHARATRLGLDRDERFAFLPFNGPAARYLHALDVYVLPSAWEAFPIGVLEAMACGVPQVVTDVGGTSEAVTEDTGLLVPPRDPANMAAAIVELLSDPNRRSAMSKASKTRHAGLFEVDRMVSQTAALYGRVLGR